MAQQVKFYSVASLPASPTGNGIYFVDNGELYKGGKRFGALKVTAGTEPSAMISGMIAGDITVSANGDAYAYNGTSWIQIAIAPSNVLQSLDVSLVGVDSGTSEVITGIKQDDGKITAYASAFPTLCTGDGDGQVKLNGINASVSGWDTVTGDISGIKASLDDHESRIGGLESWKIGTDASFTTGALTATSGTFTSSLTVGGKTVSAIADDRIAAIAEVSKSASDDGVTVSVYTKSGSVEKVEVAVDATASASDIIKDSTKLVRAGDVVNYLSDVTKAMHFVGVKNKSVLNETTHSGSAGDLIIVDSKEYVSDGTKWIELGDESELGNLTEYTGYNTTLTNGASNLAAGINALDASIKAMDFSSSITDNGVTTTITQADGKITAFGLTVDAIDTIAYSESNATKLPTTSAVYYFVTGSINALTGSVSDSSNGVGITVNEEGGKLTSAEVSVDPSVLADAMSLTKFVGKDIDTSGAFTTGSQSIPTVGAVQTFVDGRINQLDATVKDAESGGVITIVESDGKLTSVTLNKATTISDSSTASDAKLATEKAVRDAISAGTTIAAETKTDTDKGIKVDVTTQNGSVKAVDVTTTLVDTLDFATPSTEEIPSEKAVVDALCWLGANGTPL